MDNQDESAGEVLIINPEELQIILDRASVEDVPLLVTALKHAYKLLEAHRLAIELYDALLDKMDEVHSARLELLQNLRDRDNAVWEALNFLKEFRARERSDGSDKT
jgi:transcription elongation factor GreA-like protein